jgi:hypothetical protein
LARLVGKAESTVRKWIARRDWMFALEPPWDVAKVRAWAEIHVHPDPAAAYRKRMAAAEMGSGEFGRMEPLTKARFQATLERALLIRQRRLVEAGQLHNVEECRQRRLRQVHEVKSRLVDLPRAMANALAGQDAETIERVLMEQVTAMLQELAADGGKGTT